MTGGVVTWQRGMPPLGRSVVAIGVFDGVHLGHQKLLHETVAEAHRLHARPVALTFDRDPDQVVTPEAAAPQLLTLPDKSRFILDAHIDTVLVVPFTPEIASMPAEQFLDEVLGHCCSVEAVHVGRDFRFGAKAAGDIDTLYVWGVEHNAEVRPHELVEVDGAPVTSTRIRRLVAQGEVSQAADLLGRPTRIAGRVHRGREQGREIGFPTANVVPVPFAAVPGDGVYSGRAVLPDDRSFHAAISIGLPPSFADAEHYVEAHLLGFDGDLYGADLTLEFVQRIRDLRTFEGVDELSAAIRADVAAVSAALEASPARLPAEPYSPWYVEDGEPLIEDPELLQEAEEAVAEIDPMDAYGSSDEEWVELAGPRRLAGVYGDAGFTAALVTAPLDAAGIPHVWDPYPPEEMPGALAVHGGHFRTFTLLVPASRLPEAERLLGLNRPEPLPMASSAPVVQRPAPEAPSSRVSPVAEEDRPVAGTIIAWLLILLAFVLFLLTRL